MIEQMKITGKVHVEHIKDSGEVSIYDFNNLVVDTGKNFIASRMNGTTPAVMSHIAVGSSNTAPASNQTALVAELARKAMAPSVTTNVLTMTVTFNPGEATGTINEAGVFNASSAGTMLCRTLFPSTITKNAGDTLAITWTVTVN